MDLRTYHIADGIDAEKIATERAATSPVSARMIMAIHRGHCTRDALVGVLGTTVSSVNTALARLVSEGVVTRPSPETLWEDIPDVTATPKVGVTQNRRR